MKDQRITLKGVSPRMPAHMRITFSLPASAGNRLQRQESSLRFTFAGTQ
jgi:hypothetical protein